MSKISVDEITDEAGTGAPDFINGATFGDNDKIIMGADSDLQIYHDGSNSYVAEGGTGDLILQGAGQLHLKNSDNDEYYVICNDDGAVQIRHDNATKLATTSTGVSVTGTVNATSYTGNGSGLTGVGASTTAGAVGTYGFCDTSSTSNLEAGGTVAGSTMSWANLHPVVSASPALAGTWRVMGRSIGTYSTTSTITLWVRIA